MSKEIQIFKNEEFGQVRILTINSEPYFVGKDVAEILGYSNTPKAIRDHVDYEDKLTERIVLSGQNREVIVINESGLYNLILSSKLPNAKKFRRWVTSEVLPSIRKHGVYMTDDTLEKALTSPDFLIQLATQLKNEKEERERLEVENTQQKQIIGELKPKADYTDLILKNKGLVTITQIAKDYGLSGQALNDKLHELKVQYKVGEQWLLYSKYHSKGYTHSETIPITHSDGRADVKMNTKWTQKGRLFIYNLLKANGILPMIEREVA